MDLRAGSQRKQIADVLAIGAPIAVGLSMATIPIRLVVEGNTRVVCGSIRDLLVGFLAGAGPALDLAGIALGVAALVLGARLKGYAITGILLAIMVLPVFAIFAFTACY